MPLTVGVDTWITTEEADALLKYRVGAASWFVLEPDAADAGDSKSLFLASAYALLFNIAPGLPVETTDAKLRKAQAETAYFLLNYFEDFEGREVAQATGLTEFTFSKRTEKFNGKGVELPQNILNLLGPYYENGGQYIVQLRTC